MPLNLPPPDKRQLARSPLSLVVCQVQYENSPVVSDARFVLGFHEALGGRKGLYPTVEPLQEQRFNISVGTEGPQSAASGLQIGWRLLSKDRHWAVSIMPTHVSLQTTNYTTWSGDFRKRLHSVLDATAMHVSPALEQRLGLRYVDRVTEPAVDSPQEWRDYIAPEFLGPILHEQLGPAVVASLQQIELDAGEDMRCSIRQGLAPDSAREDSLTYLLDFDIYRQDVRDFDSDDVKGAADAFNVLALQLFQQAVTDRLREFLATE